MDSLFEALRTMTIGDFLRLLALMTPAIAAIWAAFRWAYGARLKIVETSLSELRSDFDRKLLRELDKIKEQHSSQVQSTITELKESENRCERLLADLESLHRASRNLSGGKPSEFTKLWRELDLRYFRRKKMLEFQGRIQRDSVGDIP